MATDLIVIKIDRARALLAQVASATDAKRVADLARAAEVYARRQKLSEEIIVHATAVKVDALTLMGEFLKVAPKNEGTKGRLGPGPGRGKKNGGFKNNPPFSDTSPTLSDQGCPDKNTNHAAHFLADIKKSEPALHQKIRQGQKTITQVKRELKEEKREQQRQENQARIDVAPTIQEALTLKAFTTIVIDPPWDWGDEGDVDQLGRARPAYQVMSLEDLLKFPIGDYAAADAHIYLWITNRSLPKGFQLLEAWGFRYITCLTWCKPSFGMGNYYRGQTEQILFGLAGHCH